MADNIELSAGSGGAVLSTDEVTRSTVVQHVQYVKLMNGTDAAVDVIPGDATNGLDVDVTRSALPTGASTSANQTTIIGHLDGVEGLLTTLAGAVAGTEVQADVLTLPALPAGTNNIGDVDIASIAAGDNNIGNVDVVSSALPTGAATAANQSTAIGHLATLAGAVAGTEMQVDIVAGGVTGRAEDAAHASGHEGVVILAVRRDTAAVGSDTDGDYSTINVNSSGRLYASATIDAALPAGANAVGDVGLIGRASGGLTIFRSIDLDESEEEIKGSAGQLYLIHAMNMAASVRYLKFYNATAANVTVGTTTPVLTFPIPTMADTNGAGFVVAIPQGLAFGTAITAAATTGLADADTGAPGANEVIVNIGYA